MNEITIPQPFLSAPLEDQLLILARHGSPSLHQMDDGTWYCKISMRVASGGVNFEVKSDFKQKTPSAAATQTLIRMVETLNKYGVKV